MARRCPRAELCLSRAVPDKDGRPRAGYVPKDMTFCIKCHRALAEQKARQEEERAARRASRDPDVRLFRKERKRATTRYERLMQEAAQEFDAWDAVRLGQTPSAMAAARRRGGINATRRKAA